MDTDAARPWPFPPEDDYVYHMVPTNLRGTTLYPLNRLSEVFPEEAEAHAAKYRGREHLMALVIPPLGCRWNDVLQCSPVHPAAIRAALAEAGRPRPPRAWFAIPLAALAPADLALYLPGETQADERFIPYTPGCLEPHRALPEAQRRMYARTPPERPVMLFGGIAHLLYRGTLDVSSVPVFEA